jgi:hypothetical protein
VRAPSLKHLPALLVPTAAAWVLAGAGLELPAPVVVVTVAVAAVLLVRNLVPAAHPTGPVAWAGALVLWVAADAALRPVAAFDAARCAAVGLVAVALLAAGGMPRVAAWGRVAVVCAATCAALWMVVERVQHAARPAGPFGNPNGAATIVLLGLALVPFVRAPRAVRGLLLAVEASGIVASGSRGALLGAIAIAIVWGVTGSRNWRLAAGAAALAAAALIGIGIRLAVDRDPLRYERVRIWSVALKVAVAEFPLGCGPGGYADAAIAHNFPRDGEFARYARIPDLAESDILAAAASLGLPGCALVAGLLACTAVRLRNRGPAAWGVAAALVLTSAVNSQAMVVGVVWAGALALGAVLPRRHGRRLHEPRAAAVATIGALSVMAATVLSCPNWGVGASPAAAVDRAEAVLRAHPESDGALADAETQVSLACSARPRFARAWCLLGRIRLTRAALRDEEALASAAADAYAQGRKINPLDVWCALGEGVARRALGDRTAALRALGTAIMLEPNCAPAWFELAALRLAQGEIETARVALRRAEAATRRAIGATFVTNYERELARLDPSAVARLRATLGEER